MKKVLWAVLLLLAVAYGYIVYGWWQEGNRNIDWQRWCAQYENEFDEAKVPSGCREYYNRGR